MQGSPADLAKSGVDFAKLVGTVEKMENDKIGRQMSRQSSVDSVASSNSSNDGFRTVDDADENYENKDKGVQMEISSKGKLNGSILRNYFASGGHWCVHILLGVLFIFVQLLASAADYWVSIW